MNDLKNKQFKRPVNNFKSQGTLQRYHNRGRSITMENALVEKDLNKNHNSVVSTNVNTGNLLFITLV